MMWIDGGVQIKLYVSTSGDFVSLGTRTEYPFTNAGGIPAGWTRWLDNGAVQADVNWTVQDGRFSVSNASATDAHNGRYYGITRDFPTVANHRYVVYVQSRQMEGKSKANRLVQVQGDGTGSRYGTVNVNYDDWEQIATWHDASANGFVRVYIAMNPYWANSADFKFDWGGQFQSLAIVDIDKNIPAPTWHEVTCDTIGVRTSHGRDRMGSRYEVASAEVTVNNDDGEFAYQVNHPWGFRPGRFIRIVALTPDAPTTERPMYMGIIDTITDAYSLEGHAVVNLACIDVSSLLSNTDVPTVTAPDFPMDSGYRFTMVYMAAGWAGSMSSVDEGVFIQQGILASGRTVRDELAIIADSEGGYFYADRIGKLVYHDREAPTKISAWNVVQAELLAECPKWDTPVKIELPGVAGNYLSVPHETGFNVGPAMQITALVRMDNQTGPTQNIMSKGTGWVFRKNSGTKRLEAYMGGAVLISTAALPYFPGETFWVRVGRSVDNTVAFGHAIWNGVDDTIPAVGSFTRLGDILTASAALPTNTDSIQVGAYDIGGTYPFDGRIRRVTLFKSNSSSSAIALDIREPDLSGNVGASSVILPSGQLMSVHQTTGNQILQADPSAPPSGLIPSDTVPTVGDPPIAMLQSLETDWSRDRIINDLQLANQGGSAFQFVDADSQKRYGPRTYQRLDFVNRNDHPEYLTTRAADIMDGFTDAVLRVNAIGFRPSPDTYKWSCIAFLNDLVRVRYTHPTGNWGFSVASHIQGIEHSISPRDWQVMIRLDEPEAFNRWVIATNGWDEGLWDDAIWDGE